MILIKKLPIPICGLMLGLAALGNLIAPYSQSSRILLGSISGLIFIMLVLKLLLFPKVILEGLQNPVIAGVLATFPMGMMILSTYIKPYVGQFAFAVWIFALILNVSLVVYFTKRFIFNFNIKKVFASYFVLYVGIVVGSVTAPAYGMTKLGQIIFWYGLIVYLPLIPLVLYRVFAVKEIPEPAQPITIIFAAPASLLLAGYMSSFTDKNLGMVIFLIALSLLMTLYGLILMIKMLRLKFYPSYSAFTFPFVISAIAITMADKYLLSIDKGIPFLKYVVNFETIWATTMVVYVLFRYIIFIVKEARAVVKPQTNI
ncbi:TDT family transporter [Clostridium sp. D2Q-11]|uniref:TDT family transporter n=1 Tax=Anaeromonas frigoriresistens TaxID=2683708 RepID=A0A942UVE7_9FIRM|nr:TDT family transporter [Anaeromonas frigoriresistens]MBS4538755.1 TDT family transporter [Anaeromonas frigoriresistens]